MSDETIPAVATAPTTEPPPTEPAYTAPEQRPAFDLVLGTLWDVAVASLRGVLPWKHS